MNATRRDFLKTSLAGLGFFTLESATPLWVQQLAHAGETCLNSDRILVILQQSGGNDGLNTVIPRSDPIYYSPDVRPRIGVPKGADIKLSDKTGLHPQLSDIAAWYDRGKVAIIQNVGYPNPNFSHFISTDYWEFGSAPGEVMPRTGWVARMYNHACTTEEQTNALFMMTAGRAGSTPDTFKGMIGYVPPTIDRASSYKLYASDDKALRLAALSKLANIPADSTDNDDIAFLRQAQQTAQQSVLDIAVADKQPLLVPADSYTSDSLGRGLKLASKIIRSGFKTRLFYVSQGGYDTHAGQVDPSDPLNAGNHPKLMNKFNRNVNGFLKEMELSGNLDRVLIMTFSEFGRRVKENGSLGTDHGAGNCLFVLGGAVKGGLYGGQPDLNKNHLIKGNLRYKIDYRSIYGRVLEGWLGQSPTQIFSQTVYDNVIKPQYAEIDFI